MLMLQPPLVFVTVATLLLVAVTVTVTASDSSNYNGNNKDTNVYPWGTNPNTHFKMYWKDAANVVQDLTEFSSLYITVHGCVWSECGVDNFDDDGENHDGDEQWYQTRTDTFCANAAYSLYGVRKHSMPRWFWSKCSKGTYINSFFTYGGADLLARALDLNINTKDGNRYMANYDDYDDDGYVTSNSDCVAVDNSGRERFLEDNNNDNNNNNNNNGISTTMGCAVQTGSKYNKFVVAAFDGDYCEGPNFLETMDDLNSYNKAMNKVKCHKIFDLGSYTRQQKANSYNNNNNNNNNRDLLQLQDLEQLIVNSLLQPLEQPEDEVEANNVEDEEEEKEVTFDPSEATEDHRQLNENNNNNNQNNKKTYDSVAENLLFHSWACDLSLYPQACPDPYGLKLKYDNVFLAASKGQPIAMAVLNAKLRKPLGILTIVFALMAIYLLGFAYYLHNQQYLRLHGGGWRGMGAVVKRDILAMGVAIQAGVARAQSHWAESKKKRSSSSSSKSKKSTSHHSKKHKRKKKKRGSGLWSALVLGSGSSSKRSGSKRNKKLKRSASSTKSSSANRSMDEETATQYSEMSEPEINYNLNNNNAAAVAAVSGGGTSQYSSTRTSKAAEAAFAAAAQFDLEQQQQQQQQQRHSQKNMAKDGGTTILPPARGRSKSNPSAAAAAAAAARPRTRSRSANSKSPEEPSGYSALV